MKVQRGRRLQAAILCVCVSQGKEKRQNSIFFGTPIREKYTLSWLSFARISRLDIRVLPCTSSAVAFGILVGIFSRFPPKTK
jgi:hypothetical protein